MPSMFNGLWKCKKQHYGTSGWRRFWYPSHVTSSHSSVELRGSDSVWRKWQQLLARFVRFTYLCVHVNMRIRGYKYIQTTAITATVARLLIAIMIIIIFVFLDYKTHKYKNSGHMLNMFNVTSYNTFSSFSGGLICNLSTKDTQQNEPGSDCSERRPYASVL